ncbi:MAG: cysteine desulfurase NifS [Verrucomicrobiae bacterium]|nr:cysteine desulfurase NifS [Verrucomicrobiae bacterium]
MKLSPKDLVYLDNNATTAVAPEVFEAMKPFLTEFWGNPSSAYRFGSQVHAGVEEAREKIAALLGADPKEIIFTSCGTESNNAAINSALEVTGKKKVVTTAVEHSAIINPCERLQKKGIEVVFLPVRSDGTLDVAEVAKAVDDRTAVCSVMWANNETGVIFPVEEIAALCKRRGVLFHTDAVQAISKIPIHLKTNQVDMLSLVGHKLHAPKGVGALYLRRRTRFAPTLVGGHQERGKRGGTENVASIVGFGRACELAGAQMTEKNTRVRALRDRLENEILARIPDVYVNGHRDLRLPNTTNVAFDFVEAEAVLLLLDKADICASSGSACTTGSLDPSHVLKAMGLTPARARGAVRFSLSVDNTDRDVDRVLEILPGIIQRLREISPLHHGHRDNEKYDVEAARARFEQEQSHESESEVATA